MEEEALDTKTLTQGEVAYLEVLEEVQVREMVLHQVVVQQHTVMMVVMPHLLEGITELVVAVAVVQELLVVMVIQALAHQITKQAVMVALVYHRP